MSVAAIFNRPSGTRLFNLAHIPGDKSPGYCQSSLTGLL
jgi:hypothetical protein